MPRLSADRAITSSWVLPASVVAVAAVAPFERPIPGAVLGFTITTVELALLIALGFTLAAWRGSPASFTWRTPITAPLAALVAIAIVAAFAAPQLNAGALRVAARFTAALLLFLTIVNVARPERIARRVVAALLAAAAVVGAIAVLELAQLPWVLDALKAFRPGFHVVGGQLRATSTLFYPTITSMFLEVAFALGLVWLASSRLAFAALVLTAAGIVATFTRAGLITMASSVMIYGSVLYFHRRRWSGEHTRLAALAAAIVALVLMSRSPQMLMARMSVEGSQDWYGASYSVPGRLTLRPDSFTDIPVSLTNRGRLTWQSTSTPPFALSYHFLTAGTEEVVVFDGLRTGFPEPVRPGERVAMQARVRAPNHPGHYTLLWDVVQEHRTWLSLEGVFPGRTAVIVEGPPSGPPPTMGRMPSSVMKMPRMVLWSTAWTIAQERPLLGIGPDNYRHVYGRYLGMSAWDERVHTNNSYIEVLVGMGVVGVLALVWLIAAAIPSAWRVVSNATGHRVPLAAAAAAACIAIAAHALVDSFLTFTPTYVVFAIAAGLLFGSAAGTTPAPGEADGAHRV